MMGARGGDLVALARISPHGLCSAQAARECGSEIILVQPSGALGSHDQIWMAQLEHEVLGARIAGVGHGLEATQNDLLQRRRDIWPQSARRGRVAPYAPAHLTHARRNAERQLAGRELIEDGAKRKDIAASVRPHAHQLLGRHVFGRSYRPMELFLEQVGQQLMTRQAEIDQHGGAGGAKQDVCWLEIEVQHVLLVQG